MKDSTFQRRCSVLRFARNPLCMRVTENSPKSASLPVSDFPREPEPQRLQGQQDQPRGLAWCPAYGGGKVRLSLSHACRGDFSHRRPSLGRCGNSVRHQFPNVLRAATKYSFYFARQRSKCQDSQSLSPQKQTDGAARHLPSRIEILLIVQAHMMWGGRSLHRSPLILLPYVRISTNVTGDFENVTVGSRMPSCAN